MKRLGTVLVAAVFGLAAIGLVFGAPIPGGLVGETAVAPVQQAEPPVPDPGVAHRMEAYGETAEEARQAIEWEGNVADFKSDLISEVPQDRFAGFWIQQEPEWKVVIGLVGSDIPPGLASAISSLPFPVEIRSGAALTEEQMKGILTELQETYPESWGSVNAGRIRFILPPIEGVDEAEFGAELEAQYGVPFEIIFGWTRFAAIADIRGGAT